MKQLSIKTTLTTLTTVFICQTSLGTLTVVCCITRSGKLYRVRVEGILELAELNWSGIIVVQGVWQVTRIRGVVL